VKSLDRPPWSRVVSMMTVGTAVRRHRAAAMGPPETRPAVRRLYDTVRAPSSMT